MNHSFRITLAALSLSLSPMLLFAQVKPLKEDLLKLLELVPAACPSMEEARAKCADPTSGNCTTDRLTAAFHQAYEAKTTARLTGASGMNAQQEELMRKMQDPAFQEEVKQMSPEQLMALSTQMQGGSLPSSGIPTEAETALAEEYSRINQDGMDFFTKYTTEWAGTLNALEQRKQAIEQARWAEVEKCPRETSGEMTITSPKCCAVVEKKYDGQWQAAVAEWLPKANDIVKRYTAGTKARYAEVEKRIAALGYGDQCGVQMFYDMVTATQGQVLGSCEAVTTMAAQTWQVACENAVGIDREMICP